MIRRRGLAKVGVVVLSVVLALSLIMIPITAEAAVVELKQQDFQEAINHQGTKTAKGLTYEKEGERECFYFDPGEYKLAENIDLGVAFIECRGEYVFDLNGKNISNVGLTALLFLNDSDVKVFGNGTIKCVSAGISAKDSNVVLEDTTLDSGLSFWSDTREVNLVINNSKVMDSIYVHGENAFATINGGEFYGGEFEDREMGNPSCTVTDQATLIINDGYFETASSVIDANKNGDLRLPARLIVINGGTFRSRGTDSECFGTLALISVDKVVLNGGTFIYEGSKYGPISNVYERGKDVKEVFNSFLGEGFTYSEEPEFVEDSYEDITMSWIKQKSISVVKNNNIDDNSLSPTNQSSNNGSENTSKVKAPKTGDDNLYLALVILLAIVSIGGITTYEKQKGRMKD